MTALYHSTHAIDARPRVVAAVARVAGGLGALLRAVLNRHEVSRMGDLSDHELADIGLRRTDLIVALRVPFGVDPTVRLGDIVNERYSTQDGARRVC